MTEKGHDSCKIVVSQAKPRAAVAVGERLGLLSVIDSLFELGILRKTGVRRD